ncbi:MAG: 2-amino-4-hydroxy-6-hydroxymethyldihydropteridine diphosphokinase [Bacteroidetes bacterium]|nr:MAG: 2-amino-4-hydroxy-6-hydroxymethyldihydropteridine diphosphokinase [Bacteroidota bacterium]
MTPENIRYTLGLGSNMHPRRSTLNEAIGLIESHCGEVTALSHRYISEPWGFEADSWFINQNITLCSPLPPLELLGQLQAIEHALGRRRNPSAQGYASRPIDIDILLAEERRMIHPRLHIPHPHLPERRFILLPLIDLYPEGIHPTLGLPYAQLLAQCPDTGKCERL